MRRRPFGIVLISVVALLSGFGCIGPELLWILTEGDAVAPCVVQVSGYYRDDGTYVQPFPGVVRLDEAPARTRDNYEA